MGGSVLDGLVGGSVQDELVGRSVPDALMWICTGWVGGVVFT